MMLSSWIGRGVAAAAAAVLAAGLAMRPAPAAAGTLPTPAMAPVSEGVELLMVEQRGCWSCARWKAEVMPGYALTPEGRAAPLRMVPLDGPWPDGLALGSRPTITPTFILLRGGQEAARLVGYPGKDHFWPLLDAMLSEAGVALPRGAGGGRDAGG